MANNNETNNSNQDIKEEQKDQFRNFVEGSTDGIENDPVNQHKSRIMDKQNRMIDKRNLRK